MRVCQRSSSSIAGFIFSRSLSVFLSLAMAVLLAPVAHGQGTYAAQIRGVVTDQSGAVVANATITITNDGTNIAQTAQTNEHGEYFLSGLRPSVYTLKAQVAGFRVSEKKNVVLQVINRPALISCCIR
jgi:hypothetical protein